MLDGILDEDLDEKQVSHLGAGRLGTVLIVIGGFLILKSFNDYNSLYTVGISRMLPSRNGIIFNFSLGIIFITNGLVLFTKKDIGYYLTAGIISGIFTYSFFLILNKISFVIEGIMYTIPYLLLNIVPIIFLIYHKEKLTNPKLTYTCIILGIIIGTLPFLLKDMIKFI